jgi:hypothetical protein
MPFKYPDKGAAFESADAKFIYYANAVDRKIWRLTSLTTRSPSLPRFTWNTGVAGPCQ